MVWATGVVMGALILGMTGAGALGTLAQSGATVAAGAASGVAAKGTEALATSPTDYAVDLLLRPAPRPAGGTAAAPAMPAAQASQPAQDVDALRTEAGRIFTATINNRAFAARDRDYLTQVVASRTGLPEAEAQRRVDAAVTEARGPRNQGPRDRRQGAQGRADRRVCRGGNAADQPGFCMRGSEPGRTAPRQQRRA